MMQGHVNECDVRSWGWDLALADEEHAPPTPFKRGWSHITEEDVASAVLAPGVDFLYIPSNTPVLDPDEVVHPGVPDLMAILEPKEPAMDAHALVATQADFTGRMLPAPAAPTTVVHLTAVPMLDRMVGDIDVEIERVQRAAKDEVARLRLAKRVLRKVAA